MFPKRCHEKEEIQWNLYDSEDLPGKTCPVFLSFQYQACFSMWEQYERGHLPDPGGALQQADWWLQVFKAIDTGMKSVVPQPKQPTDTDEG